MKGIDRRTGRTLSGWALFVSHAEDVLTTQKGSRQKRREYGSRCPELRGKNNGVNNQMLMRAYVAEAFVDPFNGLVDRFKLKNIKVTPVASGFRVIISGEYLGQARRFGVDI